ncbi:NTP transferase domain-containing protein [Candidatus Woesearchaeota archaeon]|nr:NTP transferase domain-containing protein [Candidatus Woesearchaeota archaeon]
MAIEDRLKGIILAGGTGSRLKQNTEVQNKHLVRVGKYPMIEYPLATLAKLGVNDITVVTGAEHAGSIMNYLTRRHPEIDFTYKVQKEAGGIAQALALTRNVVEGHKIAVILGDNIYEEDFRLYASGFLQKNEGCQLFLKRVPDPHRFGVAEVRDGRVFSIEEKPTHPKSNLAVTGLYFFDASVFDKIGQLKPSARGEYEITDVNNMYVHEDRACVALVDGFWSDAGTLPSLDHCEEWLRESGYDPLRAK